MYPSEKASEAFQRGYRDCRDNRRDPQYAYGTFYAVDYVDGWEACWNEQYWDAVKENKKR